MSEDERKDRLDWNAEPPPETPGVAMSVTVEREKGVTPPEADGKEVPVEKHSRRRPKREPKLGPRSHEKITKELDAALARIEKLKARLAEARGRVEQLVEEVNEAAGAE